MNEIIEKMADAIHRVDYCGRSLSEKPESTQILFKEFAKAALAALAEYVVILEDAVPVIGDIMLNCDDDPARVVRDDKQALGQYEIRLREAREFNGNGARIIMRAGKPVITVKRGNV